VREPHEYDISRIAGSILIPKDTLASKLSELDDAKTYVMQCKSGARSRESTELMRGAGFKAYNLFGGINAYARQVDDSIPTY
jgi:rhodanese-related sulfurtransferase